MTARASVISLLEGDGILSELGFSTFLPTNAVDTPPETRFGVVSWGISNPAYGTTEVTELAVWLHDQENSYSKIRSGLKRVRDILLDANNVLGEDGSVFVTATYRGESNDLRDDGYGTVTRHVDFGVLSR